MWCCDKHNRKRPWWGSNLPNDVAAGLDPVVEEGKTCVGNEVGEAHVCDCSEIERRDMQSLDEVRRRGQHRVLDVERLGARKNLSAAKEGLAARAFVLPLYTLLIL